MQSIVIIPTYNERDNIQKLIQGVLALFPDMQVLVVDDNSPDGTGKLVQFLSQERQNIHVIHRPSKLGLASAYREGFKWALEKDFDYILQMDGDLSHRPEDMLKILEKTDAGADLIIGSRYKDELRVKGWSIFRISLSYLANFYIRIFLGTKIYDMTSGFRCFRSGVLRTVDLSEIISEGYAFQIEMAYLYWKKGYLVEEVPITFIERETGKSKFNLKIIIEAFFTVLRIKFLIKS